ncbi:MAG: LCP family protein [Acidimicrobiaceae bacterium]|nr:LCP family protein [Acidimicrobiaceae bacterium]
MPSDSPDAPRGRSRRSTPAPGGLANAHRLAALGEAIDEKTGVKPRKRKNKVPKSARTGWRRHKKLIYSSVSVVLVIVLLIGGGYLYTLWQLGHIKKINVAGEVARVGNQPFNILEIGSDSRAGLSGYIAAQTGASTGQAAGQRSDVVKIMHVDPAKGTITVLSIPRDTVTTLLANQGLFGKANRLNVNFGTGPSLLAQTITANFGIPIAHTVVVSFEGIINAAQAIGGVYMNFPYPAKDAFSGLNFPHAGCQIVNNFQALALVRSRHYQWYQNGVWTTDVTSDYGRIYRQNEFLKAMIDKAKGLYNPFTINSFISKLTTGVALDSNFSAGELIGLAIKFHNLDPANLVTYTLPTAPGSYGNLGSILFVQEPTMQKLLYQIFGSQLQKPTNPPPVNSAGYSPGWTIPTTTATTSSVVIPSTGAKFLVNVAASTATTTTTIPPEGQQYFDPTPCTPK